MPRLHLTSVRTKMLVVLLPIVAVAIVGLTFLAISRATTEQKASRFAEMERTTAANANDFDARVRENRAVGRSLATLMEGLDGTADRSRVNAIVNRFRERNPQVVGAYVGFEPNAFDGVDAAHRGEPGSDENGRFGPYWNTISGEPTLDYLVDQEKSEYWNKPKTTGRDSVIEPYLYDGLLMTSYTSPIRRGGRFVGIGGVDVSLAAINERVGALKILDSGYGMLVSRTGIFVASPKKSAIGKQTLAQLASERKNPALARAARDIRAGRAGQAETQDPITGKDVVLTWAPVRSGSWGFITTVPIDEVLAPVHAMRTRLLLIGLVLLLIVGAAIAVFATRLTRPIAAMTDAAERLSEGDIAVAVTVDGRDEVARLGASFERTVDYLRDMADHADRIAQGDLTRRIEPKSDGDVLGVAFHGMRAKLATLVGAVSESSQRLSAASQEMASTSQEAGRAVGEIAHAVSDVAQGAERQVRSIEAAKQATEEVGNATATGAASAQETASAAEEARRIAEDGRRAVDEATEAMRQVQESSGEVTTTMHALAAKSEQIGGIVATITGIAGQTNLLALNAAIEAARAGEQGRGFAVVAEEVRKLAEESQTAAESIAALVEEIQTETSRAVAVVEDGAERSEQGAQTVEQARDAFDRIGASVDGMTDRVAAIAAAVEQIAASAERVQQDMSEVAAVAEESSASSEQVSASTQETSASAQEIASSAEELAGTAAHLQELVGQFTVGAD